MECDVYDDQYVHKNMNHIKELISQFPDNNRGKEGDEHRTSSNNTVHLTFHKNDRCHVKLHESSGEDSQVYEDVGDGRVASDLVKLVEALIRVGCEEGQWCVLESKKGNKCNICKCHPGFVSMESGNWRIACTSRIVYRFQ